MPNSFFIKLKHTLHALLPLCFLLLLILVFSVSSPVFLSKDNLLGILRQSAVLLTVACGATFIILQGSIDLSVGSIVSFTGIAAAVMMQRWGVGIGAVPLAMLLGGAVGFVNGAIFAYGKVPSFLVTLGSLFTINGLGLVISEGRAIPISNAGYIGLASGELIGSLPNIILFSFAVYFLSIVIASRTRFGRQLYAIGGGERVARLSGVPVNRLKLLSFVYAGLLAGLGGVLMSARLRAGSPNMGEGLLLDSIAAVVIGGTALTGGMGGPHRTLLGVLIMGILGNGMNINAVDPNIQIIIKGSIVVLAVFLTVDRSKIEIMK